LLDIGHKLVTSPRNGFILNQLPAEILISLEDDRILIRDEEREIHRFRHDLLEEWVLTKVLIQHLDSLPAFIQELGQPLGLYRPMQLVGAYLLEGDEPVERWRSLIDEFENTAGIFSKWRQALCSAPFVSTRSYDLLNKLTPILMDNNGNLLRELLTILHTVEVNPGYRFSPGTNANVPLSDYQINSIAYLKPTPRWIVWLRFLKWLLEREKEIPVSLRHEVVKVFEIWQQRTENTLFRREIGILSLSWLKEVEDRYQ
jgi:hypothetical protein